MAHYTARVLDDRRLELPKGALRLVQPGEQIEIDLSEPESSPAVTPNKAGLEMLAEIERIQAGMNETDASQTDRLLREARNGAMYGL